MEVFLKKFVLLTEDEEDSLCDYYPIVKKTIFNNSYPLRIFCNKRFHEISFEPITIFYGGNGSGKTTLLNIIANKLNAERRNVEKKGVVFDLYVENSNKTLQKNGLENIKYISSDDVFDYLLDVRAINSGVNRRKEELVDEYNKYRYNGDIIRNPLRDYEKLKSQNCARANTTKQYMREKLRNNNIIQFSNGESALDFWQAQIEKNGIYILDEPENSLAADNILKLKKFIEDSARFYNCQFIISTHSPFLLALQGAKIYDLDTIPVRARKWNELQNMKIYYQFFKGHEELF